MKGASEKGIVKNQSIKLTKNDRPTSKDKKYRLHCFNLNLFLWRHLNSNSSLVFNKSSFMHLLMSDFSVRHRLQRFPLQKFWGYLGYDGPGNFEFRVIFL